MAQEILGDFREIGMLLKLDVVPSIASPANRTNVDRRILEAKSSFSMFPLFGG
jgi:hypothetical protein